MSFLLLAGCVQTKSISLNPTAQQYPPVPPDSVVILTSESELDTLEFTRLAMIEATGSGEWTSQTGMYNAMRRRAGQVGANAILLPQISEPGAGAKVAGAFLGTGTQRKGQVVAIRITGRKPASRSPAAPDSP